MAASRKGPPQDGPQPLDPRPITNKDEMQAAVELPVIDPPQTLPAGLPISESVGTSATKRIRFIRTEISVSAGGAHYSPQTGGIMELPQPVADDLIAQRVAEEI